MGRWNTRVAGVTFEGRQAHLVRLRGGEDCQIVPEPENPHDPNALKVMVACEGDVLHVGYIPRELAEIIAPLLEGEKIMARVLEVTGGFSSYASLGLRILLETPDEKVDSE